MDILVGSNGYIGSHLAARLELASVPFTRIASRRDFYGTLHSLRDQEIGTVYWCAAGIMPNKESADPREGIDEFEYLCKLISANSTHSSIVVLSTLGLADYHPALFFESDKNPVITYFENRFRYEETFFQIGCPGAILRLSNVYGPNVVHQYGVIANWIRSIKLGKPITVTDSLHTMRNFIFIEDVINAVIASSRIRDCQVLDVGSASNASLGELIELFNKFTDFEVEYLNAQHLGFRSKIPEVNLAKTHSLIHWAPDTRLHEGLKSTFEYEGLL